MAALIVELKANGEQIRDRLRCSGSIAPTFPFRLLF